MDLVAIIGLSIAAWLVLGLIGFCLIGFRMDHSRYNSLICGDVSGCIYLLILLGPLLFVCVYCLTKTPGDVSIPAGRSRKGAVSRTPKALR